MNTIQNFFKRSLGISQADDHHQNYKINSLMIQLDKEEFKSNDKITGKLIIKTYDVNIKDIGRISVRFYDELDIQWEEYQSNTLYNTIQNKTYKKPFKTNIESFLETENAVLVNEIDHNDANNTSECHHHKHQKLYEFNFMFEFNLPKFIHSTVTMPNASYAYFIEAFINSDKHNNSIFKTQNHNTCKIDVNIYNEIVTPNELLLKPLLFNNQQITELQTSSMQIRVVLPKRVYFSNEIIPISIDIDELAIAFNTATSTITTTTTVDTKSPHHHHIKLHKIVFKLYQYCKVCAEEPEKKSKVFDYLIKQTTMKIPSEKCELSSSQMSLKENFELPDQLFSSTDHDLLKEFNDLSVLTTKKLSTLSYAIDEGLHEKIGLETATESLSDNDHGFGDENFFYGIRVDYKLVIEFWRSFLNQDTVVCIPIMIDPEAS
jgi:hypothetical protein